MGTRNVLLYRLYVLFNEPLFWGPILITSLQKLAHMSLPDIYYMESVVLCFCVLLDIPSGVLADYIGRKHTIIIGRVFLLASICLFATMTNTVGAWAGNIVWSIGYSLQSGADTAFLYEALKEEGREHEFKKVEGDAVGLRLIFIACCSVVAGTLASYELRAPLLLGIPFMAIPLIAALFMKEPSQAKHYSACNQLNIFKEGARLFRSSVNIRWMIGFAALIATAGKVWFFTYNPYFALVGLNITYYGVIFFLLNAVAWLASKYAHKIEHCLGEERCIVGMIGCLSVPILLMALVPVQPSAYLVLVQNVARGFMRPFIGDYMNRHITSSVRATMLSVQSTAANLLAIVGLGAFGVLVGYASLLNALLVLGLVSLALGTLSYVSYKVQVR